MNKTVSNRSRVSYGTGQKPGATQGEVSKINYWYQLPAAVWPPPLCLNQAPIAVLRDHMSNLFLCIVRLGWEKRDKPARALGNL